MIQRSIARTGMMKGESRGEEEVEVMKSKTPHDSLHDTRLRALSYNQGPSEKWRCNGLGVSPPLRLRQQPAEPNSNRAAISRPCPCCRCRVPV